jgi:hypothetical protein
MMSAFGRALAQRTFVFLALMAFLWLMDVVYMTQFQNIFSGVDFPLASSREESVRAGIWAIGLVPILFLPLTITRPSQMLTWATYVLVLLPSVVVGIHSALSAPAVLRMMVSLVIGVAMLHGASLLPRLRLVQPAIPPKGFWLGVSLASLFFYVILYRQYGGMLHLAGLREIYIQRMLFAESGFSLLTGYAQIWLANAINPFIMAYGVYRRRRGIFAIGAALEVLLFLIGAQRSMLIAPLLLLAAYVLLRRGGRYFAVKISAGALVLWLVPFLADFSGSLNRRAFAEILFYRSFINNGIMSAWYFEYFASHPHVNFAAVKGLNLLFSSTYTINYKESLAWHYLGQAADPNAHFMADGFAQFGYPGVFIVSIVLAVSFWILDSIARSSRLPLTFVCVAIAVQVNNVANGQVPNLLVGGGFITLLLLLYLTPMGRASARVSEAANGTKAHRTLAPA